MCVTETYKLSNFLRMAVSTYIIWETTTNHFLVFNILVGIPLADLANEIIVSNEISLFELCRFV